MVWKWCHALEVWHADTQSLPKWRSGRLGSCLVCSHDQGDVMLGGFCYTHSERGEEGSHTLPGSKIERQQGRLE